MCEHFFYDQLSFPIKKMVSSIYIPFSEFIILLRLCKRTWLCISLNTVKALLQEIYVAVAYAEMEMWKSEELGE